jgi:hypothetical protein
MKKKWDTVSSLCKAKLLKIKDRDPKEVGHFFEGSPKLNQS